MRVRTLFFAAYRDLVGLSHMDVEVHDGCTVAQLVAALRGRGAPFAKLPQSPAVAVNLAYALQDVRLAADFNISAPSSSAVGLFFRAELAANPSGQGLQNFYAVTVGRGPGGNVLAITATDSAGNTTVLAGPTPIAQTSGRLEVDVTGYFPVVIDARINGTSVANFTDFVVGGPTDPRPYRGDFFYGHIFGVVFPASGGGETGMGEEVY